MDNEGRRCIRRSVCSAQLQHSPPVPTNPTHYGIPPATTHTLPDALSIGRGLVDSASDLVPASVPRPVAKGGVAVFGVMVVFWLLQKVVSTVLTFVLLGGAAYLYFRCVLLLVVHACIVPVACGCSCMRLCNCMLCLAHAKQAACSCLFTQTLMRVSYQQHHHQHHHH